MKYSVLVLALSVLLAGGCKQTVKKGQEASVVTLREDQATIAARAKDLREKSGVELAPGLTLDLWASDSLVADPVAIHVDEQGRIYYNKTNRQKSSEFDIRGHRNWMTQSISFRTPEDRRAFLRETFATEKSKENEWLKDMNEDGIHDWRDLAVQREEVWRLEDTDGDGFADFAKQVLNDFFEEITDVGHGILVRAKDAFMTVAPHLWKLEDTNGDGVWDKKTALVNGYGVHIGFSGHGMSNPIEGPDGKIYWNIGDIGSFVTKDGVDHERSNEGTISRINPDGTGFEVFAGGLRNTHEFVFDEYGNLISSDNDGDHPGEQERLVHVVDGMDAGWRTNWQFGKYTDPRNNSYKVWMDERLSVPRWEGQAAYILPPIMNYHNGPTGMQYNPGTALGSKWRNKFFLVEFVGNPARSPIWAFGLKPKGASFELDGEEKILGGILPTGIRFGPDGALYVADWINGWATKSYGRIWKLDVTAAENDLKAERAETKRLMQLDYTSQNEAALYKLLFYSDMRIRQKAQFELVKRGTKGAVEFEKAIAQRDNQLARVHGVWGMGQLTRQDRTYGKSLVPLLTDNDGEIRAQAARVIGDERIENTGSQLVALLKDPAPRIRFYGAQALGRVGYREGVQPLLTMLRENNDKDAYLRHAGVLALSRIGNVEALVALSGNADRSLRMAAVLALRRLKSEQIAVFLQDQDELIVTEAARAINDDLSIPGALPALAATLKQTRFTAEPLVRRAINAALRVGTPEQMQLVIAYAKRKDADKILRAEALATLSTWANPSVLDRVDGRNRGAIKRDETAVANLLKPHINEFLRDDNPEVLVAACAVIGEYGLQEGNDQLVALLRKSRAGNVRVEALKTLKKVKYPGMESLIKEAMQDADEQVRAAALQVLEGTDLSVEALGTITGLVFESGTLIEQQQLLKLLAGFGAGKTEAILDGLIARMKRKELNPGIRLELGEAVTASGSSRLAAVWNDFQKDGKEQAEDADLLFGGDRQRGRQYFLTNSAGECSRCHVVNGKGGEVGPDLSDIGNALSREQLVQALLEPSARISPGFGMVVLNLKDGTSVAGILTAEDTEELILKTAEAEPLRIARARIAKRDEVPSSMPPMGAIMSRHEIRDVVEFLANLKQ